jgi:two-component system sensor histidine kinase AgrC
MSLSILNYFFVLMYGLVLSLAFANVSFKKNLRSIVLVALAFTVLQLIFYGFMGPQFLYKSYPFITHIPLVLILVHYYRKPFNIALISVLTAYLLCTPRKWIGTMISLFWGYDSDISLLVQIIATIPLLVVIIKTAAPYIAGLQ